MPEKTAEALERILSLSSAKVDLAPASLPAEQYRGTGGPAFAGVDEQALLSSMFFEVVADEATKAAAGTLPRCGSEMSWTMDYNNHDQVLEANTDGAAAADQLQNGDQEPWYAHGPITYGAPHVDPYGPADKDEPGPVGPPSSDFSPSSSPSPVMWSQSQPQLQPQTPQHDGLSEYVPDWVYGTLPRDCLIMLLEGALRHMPQEADVVARCMRALAPLSLEEYEQCFGSLSNKAPELSGSAPTARQPAVDSAGASASNAGWEHVPPAQHQESVMQAIDLQRPCSPAHGMSSSRPLGSAAHEASSGAGEVRKTNNKAGARTGILLTDSRVGTRTSILTEEQAIEVFAQRRVQGTERAALCSVLADRYRVTTTAIRHIWDRKTWVWTNLPYWTEAEMAASLAEGTCKTCLNNGVNKIEDTCEHCPINRKRGRPRGSRDTHRRQRKNPQH
jgi:hypothetical protein